MPSENRAELTALLALCFQQLEVTRHAQTRDVLHCMIERLEGKLDEMECRAAPDRVEDGPSDEDRPAATAFG
jgi:hypothetical protein